LGGFKGACSQSAFAADHLSSQSLNHQPTHMRAAPHPQAKVVYAFDAEAEGELSVGEGDAIWVEAETDGWFTVVRESDGARGLVPASYVEMEGFS